MGSSDNMIEADRQEILEFLSAGQSSEYAPQSGEIVGILKQLMETFAKDLAEETAAEEAAVKAYEELVSAKKKEISALTSAVEAKTVQSGELAVSIVNMKNDLSDTEDALLADKQFLEDLSKNCEAKAAEWDEIVKTRAEEVKAISETIRVLNDDEALGLFKSTLPSAASSLIQVKVSAASLQARALAILHGTQHSTRTPSRHLDFIALALHGKKIEMAKVIGMIDEMVALLKKEQTSDDEKKSYCLSEFDTSDDKKKGLERAVSDSEASIASAEESIATLTADRSPC